MTDDAPRAERTPSLSALVLRLTVWVSKSTRPVEEPVLGEMLNQLTLSEMV